MEQVKFQGDTLGHRHRNYNKILKETIAKQSNEILTDIDLNEDDVNNLLKVDVASENRNVEYILRVLKGSDLLYVSRIIKQCHWLFTDNQYANIINPEYLHSQLFPQMMSKATNKLMLCIRLNLREETRVERFFNYYENFYLDTALKWLPHCSAAFIGTKVEKYSGSIGTALFKRLCEKNHSILKVYVGENKRNPYKSRLVVNKFQDTMFLLNTNTDFYLDLVESCESHEFPNFNAKSTHFLMKTCPERIHQNFTKYAPNIHIPTFAKYLNPNKIKDFLLTHANNAENGRMSWINYKKLQNFLKRMPQEQRLDFVMEVFLDKSFDQTKEDPKNLGMATLYRSVTKDGRYFTDSYHWYRFAPFDIALTEIKQEIKMTTDTVVKNNMLDCLTQIVGRDPKHLEALLQYYNDSDMNDCHDKKEIARSLCKHTDVLKYNTQCWNLLNNIFSSMNLYDDKSDVGFNNEFVQVIIIYNVINKRKVPEPLMKQLDCDIINRYRNSLNSEEKSQLFDFLYNLLLNKIEGKDFTNHTVFYENVELIRVMLTLLNNWNKDLANYSYILSKIQDLLKTKKDRLSWIYDVNKTWRRCMFEESIIMCPSEKICMNALKHDPSLLSRNEEEISAMRCNDTVSLKQLLFKLKVYWPQSLASEWVKAYREKLETPFGHKSLMCGLSLLLPQRDLLDIINYYKPADAKINWAENNENLLSLRKHIAKNMHYARPQPDPNMILQYAKGDYLQFALPSLNAILHNLCSVRCCEVIPRLLNSPVSLQKHGIRLAFIRMQSEDLQHTFCNYWKSVENVSIRAVMFKLSHELLCKEKNPKKIDNIWCLLNFFMDSLTLKEDKRIYNLLSQVKKIPLTVKPIYIMKSYKFLKSMLPTSGLDENKYKQSLNSLIFFINELIESMEPDFVGNILTDYVAALYTREKTDVFIHNDLVPLMVSYILYTKNNDDQVQRYELVLIPVLRHTSTVWEEIRNTDDIMKINLKKILNCLSANLRQLVNKNMTIPVTIYTDILNKLEESFSQTKNYLMVREWKLTAAFVNILIKSKATVERSHLGESCEYWDALCEQAVPKFAKVCVDFLKEDIKLFFPCIYEQFSKALSAVLNHLFSEQLQIEVLKQMLTEDVIQTYLVALIISPQHYLQPDRQENFNKLHLSILSHPSLEVKMHFYHKNKNIIHRF